MCLRQRFGFLCIAFGFLMNLRFGFKPSHYAIVLVSALYVASMALWQISFHVIPGTGAYGSPVFGIHLYTWSFMISTAVILATSFVMAIDSQYKTTHSDTANTSCLVTTLFILLMLFIAANTLSVLFECGFSRCPSNPTQYYFLK
jgi:disulfide bond formation protein DsbB